MVGEQEYVSRGRNAAERIFVSGLSTFGVMRFAHLPLICRTFVLSALSAGAAKAQQSITLREGQLGVSAIAWQQVRRDTIPISGRVIRQETLTALDGAIVVLLDSAGHQVQRVGVGSDGEFRFVGLRPGSFRLRVLRIGYEIANAVVILPLGGSVRVTAVMSLRPLE